MNLLISRGRLTRAVHRLRIYKTGITKASYLLKNTPGGSKEPVCSRCNDAETLKEPGTVLRVLDTSANSVLASILGGSTIILQIQKWMPREVKEFTQGHTAQLGFECRPSESRPELINRLRSSAQG